MRRETKFVVVALGAWFCFALALGISGSFHNFSAPKVAVTVWTLTAIAILACWVIQSVREWSSIVDLSILVAFHLVRFIGLYFLLLGRSGELPAGFAKPAGVGDIVIAAAAGLILLVPQLHRRKILFVWNTLGLIDILFVVFSALRFGLRDWESMTPLRELPLSLLPTFIVPLIITSHILIFIRLARGSEARIDPARPIPASILHK